MLIVGIAGGSGSGKTTVVKKVTEAFDSDEVIIIPQDSYYRDNRSTEPDERHKINFDHPCSIEFELLVDHLTRLRNGITVEMPLYSYLTCLRSESTVTVRPSDVVIVEGILVLADEGLRNMFDIKVFVDADADDRLGRIIKRDIEERGREIGDVLERYNSTVKPSHNMFIEPSKKYADIIIPGGGENIAGIGVLISIIEKYLSTGKSINYA
jgi:uridine kinase